MTEIIEQYPYLLPLMIFIGRIFDVTLGTLRIIFVSKGQKHIAPIFGFFEVFIWIVIISQILASANNLIAYLSYAAGYATGTYVGMIIEQKIAFGILLYRVYTKNNGKELVQLLHNKGFGATLVHGTGSLDKVDIIESVIERREMKKIQAIIHEFDKTAFYVTEDVRTTQNGIFPKTTTLLNRWRPGK